MHSAPQKTSKILTSALARHCGTLTLTCPPSLIPPQEDNFNLESRVMGDLKDLEGDAARLQTQIDEARAGKTDVLAEIIEVRA